LSTIIQIASDKIMNIRFYVTKPCSSSCNQKVKRLIDKCHKHWKYLTMMITHMLNIFHALFYLSINKTNKYLLFLILLTSYLHWSICWAKTISECAYVYVWMFWRFLFDSKFFEKSNLTRTVISELHKCIQRWFSISLVKNDSQEWS
jgi:hypothetical protein